MGWVDRALATLSPTDVAERVSAYVQNAPVEESHAALRRASLRMPHEDLMQLAMAFGLPPTSDRAAILAHFLTIPEEFKPHFERFLHRHPRALAYFEDADVKQILHLSLKRTRRQPRTADLRYPALVAALCFLVVGIGLGLGALLGRIGHASAADRGRVAMMAPKRTPAPISKPTAASTGALQGSWQISEDNALVGTIVWAGNAVISGGKTLELVLHKESVGGRTAVPCEQETQLHIAFSVRSSSQTVPYQERNCEGVASSGVVDVEGFTGGEQSFHGSFWQGNQKLGDFDAHKQSP